MNIEVTTWILWVAVGIVVALVAAGFYGGRKMLAYDLVIGVVFSIFGGFCSAYVTGDSSKSQLIVSVLCCVFLSVLGVFCLNKMVMRKPRGRQ